MPTLNWIGKEAVINHHHDVPFKTLDQKYTFVNGETIVDDCRDAKSCVNDGKDAKSCVNDGKDAKSCVNDGKDAKSCVNDGKDAKSCVSTTENKIIHGDNLEALKALLPEYEGRIKCIYIDPPYNTGNENWVYNDNVNSPRIRKWLGQVVGKEAEDLTRHDKWLCMMYPRLKLLHQLLADDGAIFISIDDNEQANLKLICDEIFGSGNFLGLITRKQSSGAKNDTSCESIITTTDYILPYRKRKFEFLPYKIKNNKSFPLKDEEGAFSTRALEMQGGGDTLIERPKMGYSIYYNKNTKDCKLLFDYNLENEQVYENPNEQLLNAGYECFRPRKRDMALGRWRWGDGTFMERFNKNLVHFDKGRVFMKERASDEIDKYPEALIIDFLNTLGTNELKEIFNQRVFDFPKPSDLLKFIFSVSTDKSSIILDSFAGSGTTAHAVLNLNKQDGGNRKFILVEMEDYAETITAERVRRVINGYGSKDARPCVSTEGTGGAFAYYELGEQMMNGDYLNENQHIEKIREYIWYTETHTAYNGTDARPCVSTGNPYYLGNHNNAGYYFYYEKNTTTTLDKAFLNTISEPADQYIIYADNCLLSDEFMRLNNIVFKKIPRDIRKF